MYSRKGENIDAVYARMLNSLTGRWEPDRRRPPDPGPTPLAIATVLVRPAAGTPGAEVLALRARALEAVTGALRAGDWTWAPPTPLRARELEVTLYGVPDDAAAARIAARLRRALAREHIPATVGAAYQRPGERLEDTQVRAWRDHVPAVRRQAEREDRGWER